MNTNHARKWENYTSIPDPQPKEQVKVRVRRRGWVTRGEKMLYVIFGLFILLSSFYLVTYASKNDSMNRDIQRLEEIIVQQQEKNNLLMYEVKELSKPERIIQVAKENGLKVNSTVKHAKPLEAE